MEFYTRWLVAALHLVGAVIAIGAVWGRGRALRGKLDPEGFRRAFYCDNWWGIATLIIYGTGIPRAFMALEKGTEYYLGNGVFWAKMALLLIAGVMEIWPMLALLRWRKEIREGQVPDTTLAPRWGLWSYVQAICMGLAIFAATAMARGMGMLG